MKLLLLGGTGEARELAQRLHQQGVDVVYSVAGLVRLPDLPCNVISGGFRMRGGLASFLSTEGISVVLDMTHPYAERMSRTAVEASMSQGVPCWRYVRPAWQPSEGDVWHWFTNWETLLVALAMKQSVFWTAGQLPEVVVRELDRRDGCPRYLLRTAVPPKIPLPRGVSGLKSIGPFKLEGEKRLMRQHNIDVLVSKNSGGTATAAKLEAARKLGLPVFLLQRPELVAANREFNELSACEEFVLQWFQGENNE